MKYKMPKHKTHFGWAGFFCGLALLFSQTATAQVNYIVWTNTSGGNWSVAANWSPNVVPSGGNDDAIITNSGTYAVTLDINANVNALTIGGAASGTQTLQTLTYSLSANTTINSNGIVSLTNSEFTAILSGTVTVAGGGLFNVDTEYMQAQVTVENGGVMLLTGGISYLGENGYVNTNYWLSVQSGGQLNAETNISLYLYAPLTNSGTCNITNGGFEIVNNDINTAAGGLVNLTNGVINIFGAGDISSGGTNSYLINQGTIYVTNTTPSMINVGISPLTGTYNTASGTTVEFEASTSPGTIIDTNNLILGGSGVYEFASGLLTLTNDTFTNLRLIGGTLVLDSSFQGGVISNLALDGITLTNNTLPVTGTLIATNSILYGSYSVAGGGLLSLDTATLDAQVTVQNGGAMHLVQFPVSLGQSSANDSNYWLLLENGAQLSAPAANILELYSPMTNSGTCYITNVTFYIYNNISIEQGGLVNLSSAVMNLVNSDIYCESASAYLTNQGTINATNGTTTISVEGTPLSGTYNAAAGTTIEFEASSSPGTSVGTNLTLGGSGQFQFTSGLLTLESNTIPNLLLTGGILELGAGFQGGAITNLTTDGIIFSNTLSVAGTLAMSNDSTVYGSFAVLSGAVLSLDYAIMDAQVTVQSGGEILLVGGGSSLGQSGTPNDANYWLWVQSGGQLNDASISLDVWCPVTNSGTFSLTNMELSIFNNNSSEFGGLVNLSGGTINLTSYAFINGSGGSDYLVNQGAISISDTNSSSTIDMDNFTNAGTLSVQHGTLTLAGSPVLQSSGTLNLDLNALADFGHITFNSAAALSGTLLVSLSNGYVPVPSNSFQVVSYPSYSGTFTSTTLPSGVSWVTNYSNTSLTITAENPSVNFTITPSAISNTYDGPITFQITGLTNGATVVVQKYIDINSNGVVDAADWLFQQFQLTDGQGPPVIAGVTNCNVPGDLNPTNGVITATINSLAGGAEQLISAQYLYVISSPTGAFSPVTNAFLVTNTPYAQSFSGTVTCNSTNVPYAIVWLAAPSPSGKDFNPLYGTVADSGGNYSIQAASGTYDLLPFASNFVANIGTSPVLTLSNANISTNLILSNATATISGSLVDATNAGLGLPGILLAANIKNGTLGFGVTSTNGNFILPALLSGLYKVGPEQEALGVHGYVGLNSNTMVSTTNGSATGVTIAFPQATALIYGSVTDINNNSLPGIGIEGDNGNNDSGTYQGESVTDQNGNYVIGVVVGNWSASIDNKNPFYADYVFSDGPSWTYNNNGDGTNISAGVAVQANFTGIVGTNTISGYVTDNNSNPLANVQMFANVTVGSTNYQAQNAYTDTNGYYSLSVFPATNWNVGVNCDCSGGNCLGSGYICPSVQTLTISNNNGAADFVAYVASYLISGYVTDANSNPIVNVGVYASATLGTNYYYEYADTDSNGYYGFGVANGSWSVGVNCNNGSDSLNALGYSCVNSQVVNIDGFSEPANFVASSGVQFTANPTSGLAPLTVNFTGPSQDAESNSITSWSWAFGDGDTSTNQSPSHIYTNAGTYYPSLVVSNSIDGATSASGPPQISVIEGLSSTSTAGSLYDAIYSQTATLLPNGLVLLAGGYNDGAEPWAQLYNPATGTWTTTGSMVTARYAHTATLLTNGLVLVAGGLNGTSITNAELYNPATGTWTPTGGLNFPRAQHTATLLPNGQVLVTGGQIDGGVYSSAELYNPANGTWSITSPMDTAAYGQTATLLTNGMVLVAGGQDNSDNYLTNAQVYCPGPQTWTPVGPMNTARQYHTATLLPDGQVLVAGGLSTTNSYLTNAEMYNPSSQTWTPTGALNTPRYYHTATLLPDGLVLAAGGLSTNGSYAPNMELYNPSTGTWTTTSPLNNARSHHTATLLPSGQVLIAAGANGVASPLASSELAGPTTNSPPGTWTTTNPLNHVRFDHTATLLPNGQVLAAAGYDNTNLVSIAELYNPALGTWTDTGSMYTACYGPTATLLPNGQVLVAGGVGYSGNPISTAQLYNPATGTWTNTGSMNNAREYQIATLLTNGLVLVATGCGDNPSTAELFNPATGTWANTGSLTVFRANATITLLTNGLVLVAGGENSDGGEINSAELYNPSTGTWTSTGSMNNAREYHTATLLPSGQVLVAGGFCICADGAITSAELYDPNTGTWSNTGSLNNAREDHTATLLPNGMVLVSAGENNSGYTNSSELYNPATGTWTTNGSLNTARLNFTTTLLPNGMALAAGGEGNNGPLNSTELFNVGLGYSASWQPQITAVTSPLTNGGSLQIAGSLFRGIAEGSGGNGSQDSPADYPVMQLSSLVNGQTLFLSTSDWSTNSYVSETVTNFPIGYAMLTAFVNGIPSAGSIINVSLPLAGTIYQFAADPTSGPSPLLVQFYGPSMDAV